MTAGRPRTVSPEPEECIKLGEELLEWLTEPTEEFRVLFGQFWALKKRMLRKEWKKLIEIPEFRPYYEACQQILAVKCLDGTLKEGQGNRYLRLYDRDLIEAENEQAKIDADLKKQSNEPIHQKIVVELNYPNASDNTVKVLPEIIPIADTECPE